MKASGPDRREPNIALQLCIIISLRLRLVCSASVGQRHSFMSEIPLSSLRKNRNRGGYTPLNDDADTEAASSSDNNNMVAVTVKAAAAGASFRNKPARRMHQYSDEPDEEAGLLEDDVYEEDEGFDRDPEPSRAKPSLVRCPATRCSFFSTTQRSPSILSKKDKDKSRTVAFHSPGVLDNSLTCKSL